MIVLRNATKGWLWDFIVGLPMLTVNRCQLRKARRNKNGKRDGHACPGELPKKGCRNKFFGVVSSCRRFLFIIQNRNQVVYRPSWARAGAIDQHIIPAVTGLVINLVHLLRCPPAVHCAAPYRQVVGVVIV